MTGLIQLLKIRLIARVYNIIVMSKKGGSDIKFYTEEKTSFRIQPKTVLIMSLVYIGLVVLLHIYAKLGTSKPVAPEAPTEAEPRAETASS